MVRDGFKLGGGVLLGIVALFLVAVLIASMSIFGWGFFKRSTADFRGQTQAIEQTKANADFRLSSYNSFFDQCSAIQGDEARLKAQRSLLASTTDEAERSRARTTIAAIEGSRGEKIRRYNTDAAKNFTSGQFRDSQLPYQIDPSVQETTCVITGS